MELQGLKHVASMQRLLVELISSRSGVKQFEPSQLSKYLACQLESEGHTRRGANTGIQGLSGSGSIFSRIVGPSIHRLEHHNWTVADTGSEYPAVHSRSSCMATTGCENSGEVAKPCTTAQSTSSFSCVSGADARLSKEAWSAHGHVYTTISEVALGREMAA